MHQQLTCNDIVGELNGMIFLYPHSGQSEATVQVIAPAYLEACVKAKMDRKDYADACSYARQNYTFFPTPAHIIKAHRDLMAGARPSQNTLSLPPPMTEERRQNHLKQCRRILAMLEQRGCKIKRVPLAKGERSR